VATKWDAEIVAQDRAAVRAFHARPADLGAPHPGAAGHHAVPPVPLIAALTHGLTLRGHRIPVLASFAVIPASFNEIRHDPMGHIADIPVPVYTVATSSPGRVVSGR
jgi:hypothetical protein